MRETDKNEGQAHTGHRDIGHPPAVVPECQQNARDDADFQYPESQAEAFEKLQTSDCTFQSSSPSVPVSIELMAQSG
jgi:hypothetical protein